MAVTMNRRRKPESGERNGVDSTLLGYTVEQDLIAAVHLMGLWTRPWFDDLFPNDPHMPRLLIGVCAGGENGNLLSLTEAAKLMSVTDSRTAHRYVDKAATYGLVEKLEGKATTPDKGDKRRVLVRPTPKLVGLVRQELAELSDDLRNVVAAMLRDGQQLPETGAAQLTLPSPEREPPNRRAESYAERARARAENSSIGWRV